MVLPFLVENQFWPIVYIPIYQIPILVNRKPLLAGDGYSPELAALLLIGLPGLLLSHLKANQVGINRPAGAGLY